MTFSSMTMDRRKFNLGLLAASVSCALPGSAAFANVEAPRKGGSVRLAVNQQTTTEVFDTARQSIAPDYIRGFCIYSYLTSLNERLEPQPEIALSWEPNEAADKWFFKIRTDVRFSDGAPLTQDDIIFSILRHRDEKVASNARQYLANVKAINKDGPDGIVVELVAPDADLPVMLSMSQFGLVKAGTYDFTKPVGTGPFIVKEFQPGLRTVLVRNPEYWKEGRPYIDQLEIIAITDHVARANALLADDVQMIVELRGNSIEEVKNSKVAQPFVTPSTRYQGLSSTIGLPPAGNPDLMFAMTHLFDRKRILDTVLKGYGDIANDHPIGKNSPYYNADLPQRELDLDKAKFHFAKSGIGASPVPVVVSDAAIYSVDMGQLLLREASRIGLNIRLQREPSDGYWSVIPRKRPFLFSGFFPRPTYNMLLSMTWKTGAAWNWTNFSNATLDKLIDDAARTVDISRRTEYYREIQAIIYNSGVQSTPCFFNFIDGVSNKVKGLTPLPTGNLRGFNFADRIWLEA